MSERDPSEAVATSARSGPLAAAIAHLLAGRIGKAEDVVRRYLAHHPDDVAALCILGDIATRAGRYTDAAGLFARAVALAPRYTEVRLNLARILARSAQIPRALDELDTLLRIDPADLPAAKLRLTLLAQIGRHDVAVAERATLIERTPRDVQLRIAQADELKTVGQVDEAIAAYRRALALDDQAGEAWWGLANLKIGTLRAADLPAMHAVIDAAGANGRRAIPTQFALARAYEDAGDYQQAFHWYDRGNQAQRRTRDYDAAATSREIDDMIAQFTRVFAEQRAGVGFPSPAPIFVLGMTRAGSTLVEQILSSHSQVEGTAELPIVPALVNRAVGADRRRHDGDFTSMLTALENDGLYGLGEDYVEAASIYRHTDRPFFVDKLPTNWMNLSLICLMLPNARIIDARREATACCFANWKQYFPLGHAFSNDLGDIASYYRDCIRTIDHIDAVLPGRIVRVDHARMVENPDREIRTLLDRLGLPFETACLSPHRTNRPVRTASSEQVRRPIFREGLDQWRHYEPWLGPLRDALGPALDYYPHDT